VALPAPDARRSGGGSALNFAAFVASGPGRVLLAVARLAFWTAAVVLAVALCRRGLTLGDEGYLLSQAADILDGKVPYRDLDLFVTPGAWYLLAGLFSFTGPSVFATRMIAAVCLIASMLVMRRVVRATGGPLWGDFAAGLVAIFAVWAWPAWSFSFYSPWASLSAMSALACVLEWMRSRRSGWLFACGVALGLTVAFKQNYGIFASAGCAAAILLDEISLAPFPMRRRELARRWADSALRIAAGAALVLVPLVAWLAHVGALEAAFESLVLRPFQGFMDAHSIRYVQFGEFWRRTQIWDAGGFIYMAVPVTSTGLRYVWSAPAVFLVEILHVALYWIPAFAFAYLGVRGIRRLRRPTSPAERSLLATTVFAAAFFMGVFPRADFNHLINVYQPVLAMLAAGSAVLFGRGRWREGRLRRTVAGFGALTFLCFACVAAVWTNNLRKSHWIPLNAPRAGVLVEPLVAEQLNHEIELLRTMTAEGEPVFAIPGLSMIPFLAERPMPTRYYNYYSVHIGRDAGLEAAREIERSGAKLVLADYNNFFADPVGMVTYGKELVSYLNRTFRPALTMNNQSRMILTRREQPLEEEPSTTLLMSCEIRPGGTPGRYVREHLLFHSLYHSFRGAWGTRNERVTTCQIQVPLAGRLRVALEVRQPGLAVEPATVRAQTWLLPTRGRPRRLFEHEWTLASESACSRNTSEEFVVDLSRWQGEVVTLLLRTLVEGPIPFAPTDFHGLSLVWDDPRIVTPAPVAANALP
jgi:hypothetical protein